MRLSHRHQHKDEKDRQNRLRLKKTGPDGQRRMVGGKSPRPDVAPEVGRATPKLLARTGGMMISISRGEPGWEPSGLRVGFELSTAAMATAHVSADLARWRNRRQGLSPATPNHSYQVTAFHSNTRTYTKIEKQTYPHTHTYPRRLQLRLENSCASCVPISVSW